MRVAREMFLPQFICRYCGCLFSCVLFVDTSCIDRFVCVVGSVGNSVVCVPGVELTFDSPLLCLLLGFSSSLISESS